MAAAVTVSAMLRFVRPAALRRCRLRSLYCLRPSVNLFRFAKSDDEQTVLEHMIHLNAFDGRRKFPRFFKAAVCDLHLVIRISGGTGMIFSTADDGQIISLNVDLHVFGGDAGEFHLYDPAFL